MNMSQSAGKKLVANSGGASHQNALRYGNYTEPGYGNHTEKGGSHHTHWKSGKKYGGSNAGGASIGGAT